MHAEFLHRDSTNWDFKFLAILLNYPFVLWKLSRPCRSAAGGDGMMEPYQVTMHNNNKKKVGSKQAHTGCPSGCLVRFSPHVTRSQKLTCQSLNLSCVGCANFSFSLKKMCARILRVLNKI